jgi:N-acetylglucosamine kinase-like BadF-type ATPase
MYNNMEILIADSGSTKTDWALVSHDGTYRLAHTQGINPIHQSREEIEHILRVELCPQFSFEQLSGVYFYGSGCAPTQQPLVCEVLATVFPEASTIKAYGDLLGAARAVCNNHEGIACILGTGANSCLYDGTTIVKNTPPLGYILGDEGSGAVLGRNFLNAIFKGFLSESLRDEYLVWSNLTYGDIIQKVYRQPMGNRFLASIAPFIAEHLDDAQLQQLVANNFRDFFDRNLVQYSGTQKVGFVGSIAYHFANILRSVAKEKGYEITVIERSPILRLVRYHSRIDFGISE